MALKIEHCRLTYETALQFDNMTTNNFCPGAYTDAAFRVILGNDLPDFRTISGFTCL